MLDRGENIDKPQPGLYAETNAPNSTEIAIVPQPDDNSWATQMGQRLDGQVGIPAEENHRVIAPPIMPENPSAAETTTNSPGIMPVALGEVATASVPAEPAQHAAMTDPERPAEGAPIEHQAEHPPKVEGVQDRTSIPEVSDRGNGPPKPPSDERGAAAGGEEPGGFLKGHPKELVNDAAQFREGLVDMSIREGLSAEQIAEGIRTELSLTTMHRTPAVSGEFKAAHPNILFTGPRIDEGTLKYQGGEAAIDYAYIVGLADETVTNPEALAEWMVKIREDLSGAVPPESIKNLASSIFVSYVRNLELHRLTANPEGKVVRYSTTPDYDEPSNPIVPSRSLAAQAESSLFYRAVHQSLRPQASTSWVTTWRREEFKLLVLPPGIKSSFTRMESTVAELGNTGHLLSLDETTGMSLVAFKDARR